METPRTTPAALDPDIFTRNLGALEQADPALAARMGTSLPETVTVEPSRDGQLNFRLVQPDGCRAWFGRTSIPSVRAPVILEQFQAGNANVLLPGIAEGTEAFLLAQRLGHHRAVFVWETSELDLQLALRLHDYADAIREERLVLLLCEPDDLGTCLAEWLRRHEGHFCPDRILMWPWQSFAEMAVCRSAVESAYQQAEDLRQRELATIRERLKSAANAAPAQPTRLAVLALHARDGVWTLGDALVAAAEAAGLPCNANLVRGPGDMHPLRRARRLLDAPPNLALLLDLTRGPLSDVLPPDIPAVSWMSPEGLVDAAGGLGPQDLVAATGQSVVRQLEAAGIDRSRIRICPPAAVWPDGVLPDSGRDLGVVLIADLEPLDAASVGHRLPTQEQIWNAALQWMEALVDTFQDADAPAALRAAEDRLGLRLDDAAARSAMTEGLARAARTMLSLALADALASAGLPLTVFGAGWPERHRERWRGAARTFGERCRIAARAHVWIHASVSGDVSAEVLTAAASGAAVVARTHPVDDAEGGLATLLEPRREYVRCASTSEIVETCEHLFGQPGERAELTAAAAARCRREHTPGARLRQLLAFVSSFSAPKRNLR